MKFCAFDLEIVKPIPEGCRDWKEIRPLGISCAATKCSGQDTVQWFPRDDNGNVILEYDDDGNLIPTAMSKYDVCELVGYLVGISKQGFVPVTWNGLGFDFDVLAEESGMFDKCRELALNHVDMMFHFLCVRGHPLGMDAAAKGAGLPGKPEGMHGDLAPEMWVKSAEERLKVLDYVASDAENTLGIAEKVQQTGMVNWVSKAGKFNSVRLGEWLTVAEAAMLPLPDTSWMTNPLQRGTLLAWTETEKKKEVCHPLQPLYIDDQGVLRFKPNKIVRFLLDNGGFDMNKLAMMDFSVEDREQFAQLIGYSVGGFSELSYVSSETWKSVERMRHEYKS